MKNRTPASSKAGIHAAPMRMAVNVDPQKKYTQTKANTIEEVRAPWLACGARPLPEDGASCCGDECAIGTTSWYLLTVPARCPLPPRQAHQRAIRLESDHRL